MEKLLSARSAALLDGNGISRKNKINVWQFANEIDQRFKISITPAI